ncbi:NATT3 protein, partial [Neodrepanis coruscans]|nr:NATT3 protein [Neodrepanis coruscans]
PQFVCSTRELGCNSGSYDPQRGPFCSFPLGGWERRARSFELLLNPGGFEALQWLEGSFGTVPEGAVEVCPSTDIFVGRSRDGLGKVSKQHQALFVALEGVEVWYKWYQVLVVKRGPALVSILDVSYNLSAARESSRGSVVV